MTPRKIIGGILVAVPISVPFIGIAVQEGIGYLLTLLAMITVLCGSVFTGMRLLGTLPKPAPRRDRRRGIEREEDDQ